ncbi:hypothetical protein [Spirochaeta cellobiosiphila]|uniref:hypothetical protein n=1 Tax=Spirochaeta cellobiosiphila TaxID=504483 RepID=UPI000414852C|nr:hypothetical protein [Spirochaeta cellobiosiphila]
MIYKKSWALLALLLITSTSLFSQSSTSEVITAYADKRTQGRKMSSILRLSMTRYRDSSVIAQASGDEANLQRIEEDFIHDIRLCLLGFTDPISDENIFTEVGIDELPSDGVYFDLHIYSLLQPGVHYTQKEMPMFIYLSVISKGQFETLTTIKYNPSINTLSYAIRNALLDYSVIFESDRPSIKNLFIMDRVIQLGTIGF